MNGEDNARRSHRRNAASARRSGTHAARNSAGAVGKSGQGTASARRPSAQSTYRSAGSSAGRSSGNAYRSSNRKKKDEKKGLYIGIGVIALVAVLSILFIVSNTMKKKAEEPSVTETEYRAGAITKDAVIDLRMLSGGAAETEAVTEATEASSEAETGANGEQMAEKDPYMLHVKGMTPAEIKETISGMYSWSLSIVNKDAAVGSIVKPTIDANATTEAATMGDAENPDALSGEEEEETEAPQDITVTEEIAVPDLIGEAVDRLIEEIEAADAEEAAETLAESETEESKKGRKEKDEETETETEPAVIYTLELSDYDDTLAAVANHAEEMWYKAPKGGSIGSYDAASDTFKMEGAASGFEVNEAELFNSLKAAVAAGDYEGEISVPGRELSSDAATSLSEYKIIGTFTTKTTSNSVRNKNIQLAAEKLNGTIVKPGEEFSFNDTVGQRTAEKGYGAAAAYNDGEVVQEVGGGICQVSTTLYNAVLRSGLKTTKRQSHTFQPNYVTAGWDATVSWGGPDYRFANIPANEEYSNKDSYAIGIKAHYANREITVSIYGRPVLKEGYSYSLSSKKVKDIDVVRKLIEPGSDKTPTTGSKGSQWTTNLVVKKDGEVVSDKLDHNTYYSGHIEYYVETPETTPVPETPSLEPPTETLPAESTQPQIIEGPNGGPGVTQTTAAETAGSSGGPGVPSEPATPNPSEPAPQNNGPGSEAPASPEAGGGPGAPGAASDVPGGMSQGGNSAPGSISGFPGAPSI